MELSSSPEGRCADLPEDIAIAIASFLQEADVCALGGCSRSWRRACDANCVWEGLFRRRWPAAATAVAAGGEGGAPCDQGWKALYVNHHGRTAVAISSVVEFVESSLHNGSLEAENYLKAIADLALMKDIGFINVQFFLLSGNRSAIINLIGLHYSIECLHILPNEVDKALQACQIAQRKVCVSLLKLGRWFYGFRLPDEYESHKISLSGLTSAEGAKVLVILNRGAVHEPIALAILLKAPIEIIAVALQLVAIFVASMAATLFVVVALQHPSMAADTSRHDHGHLLSHDGVGSRCGSGSSTSVIIQVLAKGLNLALHRQNTSIALCNCREQKALHLVDVGLPQAATTASAIQLEDELLV